MYYYYYYCHHHNSAQFDLYDGTEGLHWFRSRNYISISLAYIVKWFSTATCRPMYTDEIKLTIFLDAPLGVASYNRTTMITNITCGMCNVAIASNVVLARVSYIYCLQCVGYGSWTSSVTSQWWWTKLGIWKSIRYRRDILPVREVPRQRAHLLGKTRFLPRCMECMTRSSNEKSVCLSVCLSVKRVHCDKTEETEDMLDRDGKLY